MFHYMLLFLIIFGYSEREPGSLFDDDFRPECYRFTISLMTSSTVVLRRMNISVTEESS